MEIYFASSGAAVAIAIDTQDGDPIGIFGAGNSVGMIDWSGEGANLLALQIFNQLATQSLSLAFQQSQQLLQPLG